MKSDQIFKKDMNSVRQNKNSLKTEIGGQISGKINKNQLIPEKNVTPELKKLFKIKKLEAMVKEREKIVENVDDSDFEAEKLSPYAKINYSGVKNKIEAFELLNEGQRKLMSGKSTPNSSKSKKKVNIKSKGGTKGGILNTPDRRKPKFKPQRLTLKHFWGHVELRDKDTDHKES